MRLASPKLIQLLDEDQFVYADLYTITMIDGTVLRYTNAGAPLVVNGNVFKADGPIFSRGSISFSLGISVDSLDLQIVDDRIFQINGRSLIEHFRLGLADGATLLLERIFLDPNNLKDTSMGALVLFRGVIVEPEIDGFVIDASVVSDNDQLNIQMPRNLYQPSCQNMLFDSGCKLIQESFAMTLSVESGSSKNLIICSIDRPQGWFTQGVIQLVSGLNAGVKRTIRLHNSSGLLLTLPFDNDVIVGDQFKIYPGCDKRMDTCQNRFDNISNFKGTPYVPIPETSV